MKIRLSVEERKTILKIQRIIKSTRLNFGLFFWFSPATHENTSVGQRTKNYPKNSTHYLSIKINSFVQANAKRAGASLLFIIRKEIDGEK